MKCFISENQVVEDERRRWRNKERVCKWALYDVREKDVLDYGLLCFHVPMKKLVGIRREVVRELQKLSASPWVSDSKRVEVKIVLPRTSNVRLIYCSIFSPIITQSRHRHSQVPDTESERTEKHVTLIYFPQKIEQANFSGRASARNERKTRIHKSICYTTHRFYRQLKERWVMGREMKSGMRSFSCS